MKQGKARLMKHTQVRREISVERNTCTKNQHTDELVSHLKTKY